jgi:hypothetical protein
MERLMRLPSLHFVRVFFAGLALLGGVSISGWSQSNQAIYTDALTNGWQDWGWAPHNYSNTSPVHSGSDSVSVTISDATYQGLQIYHPDMSSAPYASISFWINGGTSGGQQLRVYGLLDAGGQANQAQGGSYNLSPLAAAAWQQITVPLSILGISNMTNFTGFVIQSSIGAAQPTFYLDEIYLITNSSPPPTVTLTYPPDGSSFAAPATINLAASVATNAETINSVQFYDGTNLLGQAGTPPYGFVWSNVSAGTYSVYAHVLYNTTNSVDSTAANVTVSGILPCSITVDALRGRHSISPLIYGTAFATSNQLLDLNFTINRSGGNAETRYNWQLNAHNHASDFYFESIGDSPPVPGAAADSFVSNTKSGGAQAAITIPMIGWAPVLGPGRAKLASYSIAKYGAQTAKDALYFPDAGNGILLATGLPITNNDPNDANTPVNVAFQQGYVQHLTNTWGTSTNGGVQYYLMDNEHTLWDSTHQDIHPVGTTMQEIFNDITNYAAMVKSIDHNALVCAPEEWGWPGYFYSGYDQQWSGVNNNYNPAQYPDRGSNGGWDYMPWLLNQMHQHDTNTGVRLLDFFTLHCYPQEHNVGATNVDPATQLLRNASTRQFWDTNYVDPSWINNIIMLIPRMKGWVASYYPGTKIGVTEYNWGAEPNINGATAQADLLGIFGREGLDLATRWTTPDASTPTYLAMKLYRNYDGNKSTFGDTSVLAGGPDPDEVSTFAALRSSDGALTVMVINKEAVFGRAVTMSISNFVMSGTAQVWQVTAANTLTRPSDVTLAGNVLSNTVPAQSITLYVLPAGISAAPRLTGATVTIPNQFSLWVNGAVGQTLILQSSTDLVNWMAVSTNSMSSTQYKFVLPIGNAARGYYRVKVGP